VFAAQSMVSALTVATMSVGGGSASGSHTHVPQLRAEVYASLHASSLCKKRATAFPPLHPLSTLRTLHVCSTT